MRLAETTEVTKEEDLFSTTSNLGSVLVAFYESEKLGTADRNALTHIVKRLKDDSCLDAEDLPWARFAALLATIKHFEKLQKSGHVISDLQVEISGLFSTPISEFANIVFSPNCPKEIAFAAVGMMERTTSAAMACQMLFSEGREKLYATLESPKSQDWQLRLALTAAQNALPEERRYEIYSRIHSSHYSKPDVAHEIFRPNCSGHLFVHLLTPTRDPLQNLTEHVRKSLLLSSDPYDSDALMEVAINASSNEEFMLVLPWIELDSLPALIRYAGEILPSKTLSFNCREYAASLLVQYCHLFFPASEISSFKSFGIFLEGFPKANEHFDVILASYGDEEALGRFQHGYGRSTNGLMDLAREMPFPRILSGATSAPFLEHCKKKIFGNKGSILGMTSEIRVLANKKIGGVNFISNQELDDAFDGFLQRPHAPAHWKANVIQFAQSLGVVLSPDVLLDATKNLRSSTNIHGTVVNYLASNPSADYLIVADNLANCNYPAVRERAAILSNLIKGNYDSAPLAKAVDFNKTTAFEVMLRQRDNSKRDHKIVDSILTEYPPIRRVLDRLYNTVHGRKKLSDLINRELKRSNSQGDSNRANAIKNLVSNIQHAAALGIHHPFRFSQQTLSQLIEFRERPRASSFERAALVLVGQDDHNGAHSDLESDIVNIIKNGYGVFLYEVDTVENAIQWLDEFRVDVPQLADLMPIISHSGYDLVQFTESRSGELKVSDTNSFHALCLSKTLAPGAQVGIIGCYAGDNVPHLMTVDTAFKMVLADRPDCEVISHDRLSYSDSFVLEKLEDGRMRYRVNG